MMANATLNTLKANNEDMDLENMDERRVNESDNANRKEEIESSLNSDENTGNAARPAALLRPYGLAWVGSGSGC